MSRTPTPVARIALGSYKHYEGCSYMVVCLARDSKTKDPMIVYTKGDGYLVCSEKLFTETVTWPDGVTRPRFSAASD